MTFTPLTDLTKKNQEFIHIATTQLIKDGKSDEEIKLLLEEILPTILENQKKGITARGLYGAPSEWAASHSKAATTPTSDQEQNENPWLMWLDSSLLIMALLGLFSGMLNAFGSGSQYGVLTFFITSFGIGGGMYFMYHTVYRHMNNGSRPKLGRAVLYLLLTTGLWSLVFFLAALIPAAVNPVLAPIPSLLIGAIAFGVRYLLKQKYNIRTAMQVNQRTTR